MDINHRKLAELSSLGALFSYQNTLFSSILNPMKNINEHQFLEMTASHQNLNIEELYEKAIIIDGIIIPRGWNKDSFEALKKSKYTGFNISLPSKNLKVAMKALVEWRNRIDENSNVLMYANRGNCSEIKGKSDDDISIEKDEKVLD